MRLLLTPDQAQFITDELVHTRPERLLHLVGRQVLPEVYDVTDLVLDEEAEASTVHCRPSRQGVRRLQELERSTGDRYLGIVEERCKLRRNGAWWQAEAVRRLESAGMNRDDALVRMLELYTEGMHSNEPVHTWDLP